MDRKKLIMIVVAAVVVGIIIWQGMGMFGGDDTTVQATKTVKPNPDIPKPASLLTQMSNQQQAPVSVAEKQTTQDQQNAQAAYLSYLTQLQILKIQKDIAETTKDITKAKLDTVTAENEMVELLKPKNQPTAASYAQNLEPSTGSTAVTPPPAPGKEVASAATAAPTEPSAYTVVSVSRIHGEWQAVLGYQGTLYNIKQGDIIADGSAVLVIDRSGVLLEKNKVKTKVPMNQII